MDESLLVSPILADYLVVENNDDDAAATNLNFDFDGSDDDRSEGVMSLGESLIDDSIHIDAVSKEDLVVSSAAAGGASMLDDDLRPNDNIDIPRRQREQDFIVSGVTAEQQQNMPVGLGLKHDKEISDHEIISRSNNNSNDNTGDCEEEDEDDINITWPEEAIVLSPPSQISHRDNHHDDDADENDRSSKKYKSPKKCITMEDERKLLSSVKKKSLCAIREEEEEDADINNEDEHTKISSKEDEKQQVPSNRFASGLLENDDSFSARKNKNTPELKKVSAASNNNVSYLSPASDEGESSFYSFQGGKESEISVNDSDLGAPSENQFASPVMRPSVVPNQFFLSPVPGEERAFATSPVDDVEQNKVDAISTLHCDSVDGTKKTEASNYGSLSPSVLLTASDNLQDAVSSPAGGNAKDGAKDNNESTLSPTINSDDRRKSISSIGNVKDLRSAQKAVNKNSSALMERLQGAAKQRILSLSRRRDSIAAKEQMLSLSSSSSSLSSESSVEERRSEGTQGSAAMSSRKKSFDGIDPYKPFSARPLPSRTMDGGQVGVPRVLKNPTTIPASPKLGQRRGRNSDIQSTAFKNVKARMKEERERRKTISGDLKPIPTQKKVRPELKPEDDPYKPFVARPLPSTTVEYASRGQAGIPKVGKRPSTVPVSPQIGVRSEQRFGSSRSSLKKSSTSSSRLFLNGRDRPQPTGKSYPAVSKSVLDAARPFERIAGGAEVRQPQLYSCSNLHSSISSLLFLHGFVCKLNGSYKGIGQD